jgi:1-deoxy-D-xylulose-5-phosphate reductoisomerase
VIHSLLEFVDGSTIAQLSINDMRCAILYALVFPDRVAGPLPALDLLSAPPFTFEPPDHDRFPAIGLARSALDHGGEMPAVLNAANEVAVTAFIGGSCAFTAITAIVADTVEAWTPRNRPLEDFAQLEAVDAESRTIAADLVKYHASMARSE